MARIYESRTIKKIFRVNFSRIKKSEDSIRWCFHCYLVVKSARFIEKILKKENLFNLENLDNLC